MNRDKQRNNNMIFESHAHYDDKAFDFDREKVLAQCKEQGIETIVNVSASLQSIKSTLALAEKYDFIYAAVGIHPDEVGELNEETFAWMRKQCEHPKAVAVGEIGLDYYWDKEGHETQKYWFCKQLDMAKELARPVIIHSREAAADTLEVLKEAQMPKGRVVLHCFSYTTEMAQEYLKMGYYIGIGGVVTFKNAKKLKEVVKMVPLERILLETDCPYLAPEPNRGKRNSSLNLPYVVEAIAQLKGIDPEEVIDTTNNNARRFYLKEGRQG